MQVRSILGGTALALIVSGFALGPAPVQAQEGQVSFPLGFPPTGGRAIAPFLDGWYNNGDGTYTLSFGYWNPNRENVVYIPVGENNYFDNADYDGLQPTVFLTGRQRGVFALVVPNEVAEESIWWRITSPNDVTNQVPGRNTAHAYELDFGVRPQGSQHPLVWFESEDDAVKGPGGIMAEETISAQVGEPVEIVVHTRDISERDRTDPRFEDPIPVRFVFYPHQGPAEVEFTRHENPADPAPAEDAPEDDDAPVDDDPALDNDEPPPGPNNEVELVEGYGTARVYTTFSAPGEYVIRARADNWGASDSSSGDQCCWTNAFIRVSVDD